MSVNKAILLGHLGKDPDVRYLEGGVAVGQFSLATTKRAQTLPNGTQIPERTEWHNIVVCVVLPKQPRSIFIKGIRYMSKAKSEAGRLKTRTVSGILSLRYLQKAWRW